MSYWITGGLVGGAGTTKGKSEAVDPNRPDGTFSTSMYRASLINSIKYENAVWHAEGLPLPSAGAPRDTTEAVQTVGVGAGWIWPHLN